MPKFRGKVEGIPFPPTNVVLGTHVFGIPLQNRQTRYLGKLHNLDQPVAKGEIQWMYLPHTRDALVPASYDLSLTKHKADGFSPSDTAVKDCAISQGPCVVHADLLASLSFL